MTVIGVDVGGTKIAAGRLADDFAIERTVVIPTPHGGISILEAIAGLVVDLQSDAAQPVTAVGVGLPATIDSETGLVAHSVHTGMGDFNAAGPLQNLIGLPVHLDNDANLAMLAEHRLGAARGMRTALLLTVGTGIGGGIVINDAIFRGGRGHGAELGHVTVEADGPPCQGNCPGRGCLETMCSGTALTRDFRAFAEANPDSPIGRLHASGSLTSITGLDLAQAGDADAIEVVAAAGRWLGAGIASLCNTFDPDIVLIGGGVSDAGELLLGPARDVYQARALPPTRRAPLALASFGPEAGMVGAGILAADAT
jgi:glucokinase